MLKFLAAVLAKLHKALRVLVRVQFAYDNEFRFDRATGTGRNVRTWVLYVRLGAGAGYVWPNFLRIPGATFFIGWRPKNYHTDPKKFAYPFTMALTRNGNNTPVPNGCGCWTTVDVF